MSVASVTLANETSESLTVVELESPAFDRVEMHEPTRPDGAGPTRKIDVLEILSGDSVAFSREAWQIRLLGPRYPLVAGQLVGITATFSSGLQRVIPFRVVENVLRG